MASPSQLSFLPDDYLDRKAQRRATAIFAVLFMMVMGGIIAAFSLSQKASRRQADEDHAVNEQYVAAARRLEQKKQLEDRRHRMAQQAELTASLLERVPRSYLLAEVTNAMPAGVSLLDFAMESRPRERQQAAADTAKTAYEQKKAARQAATGGKTPAQRGPEPRKLDVTLKVTGVAMNDSQVAQFLNRLSHSKLLKDVNLVITDEFKIKDDKLRKFQIEMALSPNAEVRPGDGKQTASTAVEIKE